MGNITVAGGELILDVFEAVGETVIRGMATLGAGENAQNFKGCTGGREKLGKRGILKGSTGGNE